MKRITMYAVVSASIGTIAAVALLAYDHLFLISPSGTNMATDFDATLIFTLCPPSFALMAMENVHGPVLMLGLAMIVAANAGLYGVFGVFVGGCVSIGNRLVGKGRSASN